MVSVDVNDPDAHLPVRRDNTVALIPIADVSDRQLEGIRWLARRHRCAEFYKAKIAEREKVDSMADVAEQLVDHFTSSL